MFKLKVDSNLQQLLTEIGKFEFPIEDLTRITTKVSQPIKQRLIANYNAGGFRNPKRNRGEHLVDTIDVFPRKKGSKTYAASYTGPKFTTFKEGEKGQGLGGQQAVFIEWGAGLVIPRKRSNRAEGGVYKREGYGIQLGKTINTGTMNPSHIIKKTMDEMEPSVITDLKTEVSLLAEKIWNK